MSLKIKLSALFVGVTLASLGFDTKADAAIFTVPPGLAPGSQYRLVFVTSTTRDATSANIDDYNTFVDNTAKATNSLLKDIPTTWKAIASTATVNAIDNTNTPTSTTGIPIYLVDGNRVADDYADLWDGEIQNAIHWTELDIDYTGYVLTLSDSTGFFQQAVGFSTSTSVAWIIESAGTSQNTALYGMSGVLTVPQSQSVPESSTLFSVITFGSYSATLSAIYSTTALRPE